MSDDVLERAEAWLEFRSQWPGEVESRALIRDLAAAVRDLRAWQATAMANHKDFERSQRELHERAEKAERALAEARADADAMEANYEGLNDLRCELENRLYPAERALDKARGLLEEWGQAADLAKDMTFVPVAYRTRAFLAAHPAPAEEGMTREQSQQEDWGPASGAGLARADTRPAPAGPCAACGKGHNSVDCPLVEMGMTWEGGDPPEPEQ